MVSTDRNDYALGEKVIITLAIHNGGDRALTIASGGSPNENARVSRGRDVVWTETGGRPQVYETQRVRPGRTYTSTFVWSQRTCPHRDTLKTERVAPGNFSVTGYFVRDDDGYGDKGYAEYWAHKPAAFVIHPS